MKLFKEKGFYSVTIDEITQTCGIAKGTFYNYFPKKEAILLHLGRAQLESVYESVQRNAHIPHFKEKIMHLFGDLFERYMEHPDLLRPMILELLRSPLLIQEEMSIWQKFEGVLSSLIDDAKQHGQLSDHFTSLDLASVWVGIYFHSLLIWISTERDVSEIKAIFQRQFELVWNGIRFEGDSES